VFNFPLQEPIAPDAKHQPLPAEIPAARNDTAINEANDQDKLPPSVPKLS
jgi:hypothetical protein